MITVKQFAIRHGITVNQDRLEYGVTRPDRPMSDMPHNWRVRLRRGRKSMTVYYSTGAGIERDPTVADILDCIRAEGAVMVNLGFEDWAEEYGYSQDSRTALATYNACVKQAAAAIRVLGADLYRQLLFEAEPS